MHEKIYIITRADLPPGLRAAQLVHAMRQFTSEHTEIDRPWYEESRFLALLEVPDKEALAELAYRAACSSIPLSLWQEPDLDHEPTALALGPSARVLVAQLPLALREAA